MAVLITGASGFIGKQVARTLAPQCKLISFSRHPLDSALSCVAAVRGDFLSFEDLRQLDSHPIEALVHLAAVLGSASEREAMEVNVEGTRRLLRYASDRGCERFVLASSIAAVGSLRADFLPLRLPIDEEHPRLVADPYGLSKAMGEDLARYFHRRSPDLDITCLRFGAVKDTATWVAPPVVVGTPVQFPFIELACVALSDVVRSVERALLSAPRPGVHVYNIVGPQASSDDEPLEVLRDRFGPDFAGIDVSSYEAGNPRAPLYSTNLARQEIGFSAEVTIRCRKLA